MRDWNYKPRFGYDIRVRPPGETEQPAHVPAGERACGHDGCPRLAAVELSRSPREPQERIWLCPEHAALHNRAWNYFEGLSAEEAEAARLSTLYGDRPTWGMGRNERARTAARSRRPPDFTDTFEFFAHAARRTTRAEPSEDRKLPRLQAKALETLNLASGAAPQEIRRRYAELVRQFHPDANGGDRSAETQLQEVVRAHHILKKAGRC